MKGMGQLVMPLRTFSSIVAEVSGHEGLPDDQVGGVEEFLGAEVKFRHGVDQFESMIKEVSNAWQSWGRDNDSLKEFSDLSEPLADGTRDLSRQADHIEKIVHRMAANSKSRRPRRFVEAFKRSTSSGHRTLEETTLLLAPSEVATGTIPCSRAI